MGESKRVTRFLRALTFLFAIVASSAAGPAGAAPGSEPTESSLGAGLERVVPPKPDHTTIEAGQSRRRVHLKFDEGTSVRVRDGEFVTLGDDDLSGVREVLERHPGIEIERTFDSASEPTLDRRTDRIEEESGREQADLNLWFRLLLPVATDEEALIDDLNALGIVELAAPEPKTLLPNHAGPTPLFVLQQDYRELAPTGIDADYATTVAGGRGQQVEIIDVERDWQYSHEDLAKAATALIPNKTPTNFDNDHGTAVIGEMVGDNNAFGVTGAADGAALGLVNNTNDEDGADVADSIALAAANLVAGDVMILEMQIDGPNGDCDSMTQEGCVPVEWFGPYYDAIVAATSAGIIVMEPSGNGNEDLGDTAIYGGPPFPSGKADSGAIMVGAANHPGCTAPVHGRSSFSNFGTRVDYHGYGECVVTTGYGDLQTDPSADFFYTDTFGGTSGATPIVTSAAAVLSSVAQQGGDANGLTSVEARTALALGATPQDTSVTAGNIGPMPDLRDALGGPTADAGGPYNTAEGTSINLDGSGSSDQAPGTITTYEWDLDNDAAYDDATGANPPFVRGDNGSYTIGLRVTDNNGNTATDTTTVNVTNVPPTATLDPAQDMQIAEGDTLSALATFTDPGYDDTYTGVIDWGDGDQDNPAAVAVTTQGPPQDEGDISGSHLYPDPGSYPVSLTVTDDDVGTDTEQFTLTVVPRCMGVPATVVGTPASETLTGTDGKDVVFADSGDDTIRTGDANDLVCAGPGDDTTHGRAGDDMVFDEGGAGVLAGGAGDDTLHGHVGPDEMWGGAGRDFLFGGAGSDFVHGGAGRDECDSGPGDDHVTHCDS